MLQTAMQPQNTWGSPSPLPVLIPKSASSVRGPEEQNPFRSLTEEPREAQRSQEELNLYTVPTEKPRAAQNRYRGAQRSPESCQRNLEEQKPYPLFLLCFSLLLPSFSSSLVSTLLFSSLLLSLLATTSALDQEKKGAFSFFNLL